jgi:hypothetical protein
MLSKVNPTPAALILITASRGLGLGSGRVIKTDFSPQLGTTMAFMKISSIFYSITKPPFKTWGFKLPNLN